MRLWLTLLVLLAPATGQAASFELTSPSFAAGGTLAQAQINAMPSCGNGGNR